MMEKEMIEMRTRMEKEMHEMRKSMEQEVHEARASLNETEIELQALQDNLETAKAGEEEHRLRAQTWEKEASRLSEYSKKLYAEIADKRSEMQGLEATVGGLEDKIFKNGQQEKIWVHRQEAVGGACFKRVSAYRMITAHED